jgi:hypothetical protein
MKIITRAIAASVLALSASSANAALIAGWDFSQYFADSVHSIDGGNNPAPSVLNSNYSSFDPNGAGAESAAFGRLHLGFTPVGDATEPLLPTAVPGTGSLIPNISEGPYNNFSVLALEGQASQSDLAMVAVQSLSIVFEADLTGVPQTGSDWSITLAAATQGGAGTVQIAFSSDGVNFASLGTTNVSSSAIAITANAAPGLSERGFFRLTLSPTVVIDNVGISANLAAVPEPAVASLLAAGLFGLARFGRRRV